MFTELISFVDGVRFGERRGEEGADRTCPFTPSVSVKFLTIIFFLLLLEEWGKRNARGEGEGVVVEEVRDRVERWIGSEDVDKGFME